jgi:putative hydrolase of the HAD superfamily
MDLKQLRAYVKPAQVIATAMQPSGSLSKPLRALLFDIYGTLFISDAGDIGLKSATPGNNDQVKMLLQKFGIDVSFADLQKKLAHQINLYHTVQKQQGRRYPEVIIDKIWSTLLPELDHKQVRAFAAEYELVVNPVFPMPNMSRALDACRRQNLPMGIISNAQFYTAYLFPLFGEGNLAQAGFDPDLVLFSYQHGHAKPSVYLFDLIVERLMRKSIPLDQVLFIGNDIRNDIKPAQQAGLKTALFAGDQRSLRRRTSDPSCVGVKPDLVITDLGQLVDFI